MIVVDASAAIQALVADGEARRILGAEQLVAPHLIDAELLGAMRRMEARRVVSSEAAGRAIERWRRLGVRRRAAHGLTERIWALRHNVTAYDATYVALAEALGCALVTADARLAAAPGPRCPITVVPR